MKKYIVLVFLFLSSCFFAQNFNDAYRLGQQNIDYDARTLSLGNSTMGALGNFSSSLLNPAGLATIKRNVLSISFNSNKFENSADFFNTSKTAVRKNSNTNQYSIVIPLPVKRGSAVIAFGYNKSRDYNSTLAFDGYNGGNNSMIQDLTAFNDNLTYDLRLSYPIFDSEDNYIRDETLINGRLNQSGTLIEEGSLKNWIMSGAAEIAKDLFFGGTFNIISGDYVSDRRYLEDDYDNNFYSDLLDPSDPQTANFESFYLVDNIDWYMNGWDFRFGLLYNYHDILSFGATVKFPSYYTIEERYSIYGESEFEDYYFTADYPGAINRYEITGPMEFSGGISASLPLTTLNASLKYVDYSQLEYSNGFSRDELFSKNNDIKEVFGGTVNWNLGAEFTLPYPALKVRAGFIYNPSPYKGDDAEYDKKYFTAGLGFPLAKVLIFDFAYVHGWWKNFGDNYGVNLSRTYQDIKVDKLVFSCSIIFM